jgi:hypothetical protein
MKDLLDTGCSGREPYDIGGLCPRQSHVRPAFAGRLELGVPDRHRLEITTHELEDRSRERVHD